jgi:two-component sensor histidine kinase
MIGRQVTHLTRLVDDLMDVSRITTGKIELDRAPLEVNTLVQVAVDSMRSTFEQYGHEISVRPAPQPVFIEGDAVRLTQVVVNLLSNAAKYTAPKGRIEVEVSRNHTAVRLDVSDNGIGMSEALIERIFEPFVQGERSLDRAEGGLGIGLTLVKKLVELHGGSVLASSAGAGHGAKFTITLPLAGDRAQPLSAVAASPRARAASVLVVDDNRDVAESLVELLEAAGCECMSRSRGARRSTSRCRRRSPRSCSMSACPTCRATTWRVACARCRRCMRRASSRRPATG